MRVKKLVFALGLFLVLLHPAHAQNSAITSGEVVVRITQGLDSSVQRPGQVSQAVVNKSDNAAIPQKSPAMVQLVADPTGGFSVQLVRVAVNGQILRTASSSVVLAPDKLASLRRLTRVPGAPQDAVSGGRVFLPQDTLVKFTLTEPPPVAAPVMPARAAAKPVGPPPAPVTGTAGDFPAGAGLPILHTDRTPNEGCRWTPLVSRRYGFAMLVMKCEAKAGENMPNYTADDPTFINSFDDDKRLTTDPSQPHRATIEVFTKPAAQPLDAAVRAQVASTLKVRWRPFCHLKRDENQSKSAAGVEKYDFTGTSGPALQVYKHADVGDTLPCAPWEDNDYASDFIYKPSESKTTFFFVLLGQEDPDFDVDSIRFLSKPQ